MNFFLKIILLVLFSFSSFNHLVFAKEPLSKKSLSLYVKNSKSLKVRSLKAIVVNQNTGEVIYEKKADAKASIASLTKLMTAMVVLDSGLDLNQKIILTKADIDRVKRTTSRLPIGTKLSRYELLKAALISSDNRAAFALSRSYPSGRKGFINAMNVKAIQLGMQNSQFQDPTGLDKRNISTAKDLLKLVRAAYQYSIIRELTTTPSESIKVGKKRNRIGFNNTNPLVRKGVWDIGLSKTGFIREAGRCLVLQTVIDGEPVIIVLLNSYGKLTRFADVKRIRNWMNRINKKKT
ncbi:serine hydrolase [Methylophilaceae bacterium]|nr:serine hydrolase [Methylophilaceae bacterium]